MATSTRPRRSDPSAPRRLLRAVGQHDCPGARPYLPHVHVCISQNVATGKQLASAKRFNCSAICPQEILDTVTERNAAGVGIADSFSPTASPFM
ncbi:hypothetical protein PF005_g31854 [Phytophthora fragariae]|uniref:Uncharacterized protein n=1 Tax=Phytophthora fragariae TaxID=53985 RepID=A0A6A3V339_9STRA|nr:hypothetical protein PF005_g31854 [Phytophthora fragariae]